MSNLLLIVFCLLIGKMAKQIKVFPENAPQTLNNFVIYFALPATILINIPNLRIHTSLLVPFLVGLIVFGLSILFFELCAYFFKYDKHTIGCLVLCCGFGNTSFVGFPLIEAWYGKEALKIAILSDQGTFLTLSTLGIWAAGFYANNQQRKSNILVQVLKFPPFVAFFMAVLLLFFQIKIPLIYVTILEKFSLTLVPLSLFSVGLQLIFDKSSFNSSAFWFGLTYKLWLAPLFFYCFLVINPTNKISIVEAAMPPMITSSLIASQFGLHPRLSISLVGIGIPLSLLSVAVWVWLLGNG